jgi:hypothetical protein
LLTANYKNTGRSDIKMVKKYPASLPRKRYWAKDIKDKATCPECGGSLENERHTYLLAVREQGDIQTFVVGNDGGYFCNKCPIIVLDGPVFAQAASLGHGNSSTGRGKDNSAKFIVLGLVNTEAIPQEKSSTPFGADDNPIPLVQFTNMSPLPEAKPRKVGKPVVKLDYPKVGRNEPCPCGSGRKYKRCCRSKA